MEQVIYSVKSIAGGLCRKERVSDRGNKSMRSTSKETKGINITETKKNIKTAGGILVFSNLAAVLIGGKIKLIILIAVPLLSYAMYLRFYPYMYFDTISKKMQGLAFQIPFIGAGIALVLCLSNLNVYECSFVEYLKIAAGITAVLVIPYIIKSLKTKTPQRLRRKISVVFAVFVISFGITFPVNYLLTFEKPVHETTRITGKDLSTSGKALDYYLCGDWKGEEKRFSVSGSVYGSTSVGDIRKICIKRSVFGLEYYTLHK